MNIADVVVNQTTGMCVMRKRIPAGTVGATVTVHFADPVWERLEKKVVFRGGELSKIADKFDGTTAVIPAEVIAKPGTALYFGIWGYDPEGVLQLPLIEVRLGQTERATQPGSDPDADPSLPIWAQLQDELNDLRDQVESGHSGGLSFAVVAELPTEDISTSTIYLVKDAEADGNVYTEYLYINGAWEMVGSQQLDLTGYATEDWVEQKLEEHSGGNADLGVTGATVGQTVKISAVDETGKPTAWEAVDFPSVSGGSGGVNWKKVVDYTLTEGATEIIVNTDAEGNPFSLISAGFVIFVPKNGENANANTSTWLYLDSGENSYFRALPSISGAKTNDRFLTGHVDTYGETLKSVTGVANMYTYGEHGYRDTYFSYLSLYCKTDGNFFPAGTRIIIAGIPADGGVDE